MSFNISQNIIVQSETEKISKFPKSGSKISLTTEDDFYFQTEIAPRKITNEQKERFIDILTYQNINMKEASKIVGMSYSTAKKVFSRFRKALKIRNSNKIAKVVDGVVCDYIQVPANQSSNLVMVSVISTIGGREQIMQQRE